ncbi:MAG: hypothetical protein WA063_00125 [Minisyncoccia bacterium]
MTLILNREGTKQKIDVKTYGAGDLKDKVIFGKYEILLQDFLDAVHYVLTNTDLEPDDLRLEFVRRVNAMKEVPGYNKNGKRLKTIILPHS